MSPHYHATSIFTTVRSVILGLPWWSLWPQLWVHLSCNLRQLHYVWNVSIQHAQTTYSLPRILSLVWFCLLFAIF